MDVGIEVANLNPVKVEKAGEERMRGEAKSPLEERLEHHGLVSFGDGEFLTCHRLSPSPRLARQHTMPDEDLQLLLQGAQCRPLQVAGWRGRLPGALLLPLPLLTCGARLGCHCPS